MKGSGILREKRNGHRLYATDAALVSLVDEQAELFSRAIAGVQTIQKSDKPVRSPFFYVGDKYKLIPQLKKHFPEYIDRYFEPFCGGGSVFLNVDANELHLNDIDFNIIKLHQFLYDFRHTQGDFFSMIETYIKKYNLSASYLGQTVPERMKQQFVKTYYAEYNKESYVKLRNTYNKNKNNYIVLYLLLIYGFNRMLRFNSKGDFNLPVGNVDFNFNVRTALCDYFQKVSEKNVKYYSVDFERFLDNAGLKAGDFIYFDPPYLISFSEYNKLWNEEIEKRLLELLDKLDGRKIKFLISNVIQHKGKTNDIFRKWARNYDTVRIKSNYISYHDNTEKDTIEVAVKNY
jgi:DNA adenine methylase